MDFAQPAQYFIHALTDWCDELEQGFRKISGYVRVSQRAAKRSRVSGLGDITVTLNAQTFLLDATVHIA